MIQGTEEKYREILKRAIASIGTKNLLSINDIGKTNSKVSLDAILRKMFHFQNGLEAVNYQAHYGEYSRLEDFIKIGFSEYVIDRLIDFDYLKERARHVIIPAQEELLQSSLVSLDAKYGKLKVTKLKKRLGIKEIHYH